ncbi:MULTISPECIES: AGE family epimerase/isomerase [unclassified Chelatococcus]|uniref:AGE family epimerase/isomerase n=1 Tax=unclassified Chelatococcus TaxID=2638111 RepID=UPI001BCAF06B|nr:MULTISPECIES: AGE family epimerase/isomerase [unclassified Chelatococcus]CAH1670109.1 putative Mannose-6-phosphate isomerase [Hyphomicrobiales bacterium]MBS7739248.1 AGE family epimerase/isomerase [Chelatococcus sp. HY11]MBX3546527.1 AGE family epimerase/isomerase [Chelatococcus sp.]MCO5076219.1 AGE family epimerase/isomerase [Chelatococcus sp.]CAH1678446.1 putative Mannose-6-phosphate isomerase [Hyphomicrobiales bacterium]
MPVSAPIHAVPTGTPSSEDVDTALARLRDWAFEVLIPFWSEAGVTDAGYFFEDLDFSGRPCPIEALHTRVQARQVYTFAHAALLTGNDHYRHLAVRGFEATAGLLWDKDHGGWLRSVTPGGRPIDPRCDAYDQCFALLALAWLHRLGEPRAEEWIEKSLAALHQRLSAPRHGGYSEFAPSPTGAPLPRRQNPHMHLMESFLALEEAGFTAAAPLSDAIVDLFLTLIERDGAIGEYFAENWEPAAGEAGRIREPGHQFEWAWLLIVYADIRHSRRAADGAHRLATYGWRHGFDGEDGHVPALIEAHDPTGAPLRDSKLLWPQTEAIKYFVRRRQNGDGAIDDSAPELARLVTSLFDHFVIADGPLWRNQISRGGTLLAQTVPTRLLYHIMTCVGVICDAAAARHARSEGIER